ncbi:MAG TPA: VIT domain-containing protein [Phycisphaerae bacterium]|nr:VIT domain-containing protein [Phycisphaerae bacterium]
MYTTRIGRGRTLGLAVLGLALLLCLPGASLAAEKQAMPGGELQILDPEGKAVGACPLKHTDVEADIVGFVGRVTVKQTFYNPLDKKIEAIYVFPLPQDAAVDDMVMTVGERRIVGQIKERSEAREIYEAAKAAGHVASLLDQERPNIFTQSVANIEPGVQVVIEISYVETLKYEDGVFEWVFPMVVGPRYIPGGGSAPAPMTTGQDTDQVPDASKITPPVTPKGTRAGHDISLTVHIEAGMELHDLESTLHEVDIASAAPGQATVTLKNQAEIPNKDFVFRYRLAADEIGDAFLVHGDERGSFFTLILQPPRRVVPQQLMPRELVFVLDTSGSMSGFPIEKAKEVMSKAIDAMRPEDTFNVITFAGRTQILWDAPRPATAENIAEAQKLLSSLKGGGGTEMMKAINAALVQTKPEGPGPIRIVMFMTDGYVGNDMAIIGAVKKNADTTRVFSFGIGNSVNRFLLDGMAHAGRGEVEYVTLESQAAAAAERFHERILAPVLTDIEINWGDLPVADIYPKRIPDLFSAKPIMIHGRLTGPAEGVITLRGNTGAGAYEVQIHAAEPESPPDHDALASLWARAKVGDLMMQDMGALQTGNFPENLKSQITNLGIEFRLMTQFTSFVAVEEMTVTVGGEPTTITVPVEMPDGVSYEGVFGEERAGVLIKKGAAAGGGLSYGYQLPMSRRGRAAGRMVVRAPTAKANGRVLFEAEAAADAAQAPATQPMTPGDKLAEALRGLAEKVEKEGTDGNLTVGKLRVIDWRVDVMVFLSDTSAETIAALKELGFIQTGESKAVKLLIGTIDVRKLEELAKLDAVIRVKPVAQ